MTPAGRKSPILCCYAFHLILTKWGRLTKPRESVLKCFALQKVRLARWGNATLIYLFRLTDCRMYFPLMTLLFLLVFFGLIDYCNSAVFLFAAGLQPQQCFLKMPHPETLCKSEGLHKHCLRFYLIISTLITSFVPWHCVFLFLFLQRCQGYVFMWGRAQPWAQLPPGGALL